MEIFEPYIRLLQALFSGLILANLFLAYRSWISKQNLDRRNLAIGYSLTKNREYFEARGRIESKFANEFGLAKPIQADIIFRMINDGNDTLARDIRVVLAHWEIMAISIFDEIIDENTCFEVVGKTLITTVHVLSKYIDAVRAQEGKERRYDYLLILNEVWAERLREASSRGAISRYEQFQIVGRDVEKFKRHLHRDHAEIDNLRKGIAQTAIQKIIWWIR